ncbi:MAG: PAS domain-containing protein [Gammaproteobacteria bacterium]|nr:PAS domain-containing protein [Gammaproteobacteria bacterium]
MDYQSIFRQSPIATCTLDKNNTILEANPAFYQLLGYTANELNKKALPRFSYLENQDAETTPAQSISQAGAQSREGSFQTKQGQTIYCIEQRCQYTDTKDQTLHTICQYLDITEQKHREQSLVLTEQRYNLSQRHAHYGVWDWNIQTNDLYWSEQIGPLLGYADGEIEANYADFIAAVHPDDREFVSEAVRAAVEDGAEYNIKHRVVWHDGSIVWHHVTGDVIRDADGTPLNMIGVTQNITQQHLADESLKQYAEQLKRAQQISNIGHWSWDIARGELHWSDKIFRIFGYRPGEFEPTYEKFIAALHPEDVERIQLSEKLAFSKGKPHSIDHRIIRPDGSVAWVHEEAIVVTNDKGEPVRLTGTVQDITERKTLEQRLSDKTALLELLHSSKNCYINTSDIKAAAEVLLQGLMELTGSEYGFTGEIMHDENGAPYLKAHVVTNIAWNDEMRAFYDANFEQGMEFRNLLDSLFGACMKEQSTVISNDPLHDERSGGLPEGHPALNAFLGAPVFYGNKMVGMYGLANRAGGYDEELASFLQPVNTTYGVIIQSYHNVQRENCIKRDLERAKEQAEAANFAKSTFLSHMSHELRTPLNAILGFAQLFEMENLSDKQSQYNKEIVNSGKHLLKLVDDLLDLSRIDTDNIELEIMPVSVKALLNECHSMIKPLLAERRLHFISSYQACEYEILADHRRLTQIIVNLLSNATKYNRMDGDIEVSCQQIENRLRILVRDTGNGIPAADMDRLFIPFDRLGKEGIDESGNGIGLTLVERLTEKMAGSIGVESTLNQGSTFWVEFPIAQTFDNNLEKQNSKAELIEIELPEKNIRVLYVEDNPANLRLIKHFFNKQETMQLYTATTATAGLEMATQLRPDIILMDIKLPDMSGFDALAHLRNSPATENIPVVAVTAIASKQDIATGLEAGFTRYLTKPLDLQELAEVLHNIHHQSGSGLKRA